MTRIERLDAAIRMVCPAIEGVSVGKWDDRKTWVVSFQQEATGNQRKAAESALDYFDPEAPEPAATPLQKLEAAGLTVADLKEILGFK